MVTGTPQTAYFTHKTRKKKLKKFKKLKKKKINTAVARYKNKYS